MFEIFLQAFVLDIVSGERKLGDLFTEGTLSVKKKIPVSVKCKEPLKNMWVIAYKGQLLFNKDDPLQFETYKSFILGEINVTQEEIDREKQFYDWLFDFNSNKNRFPLIDDIYNSIKHLPIEIIFPFFKGSIYQQNFSDEHPQETKTLPNIANYEHAAQINDSRYKFYLFILGINADGAHFHLDYFRYYYLCNLFKLQLHYY